MIRFNKTRRYIQLFFLSVSVVLFALLIAGVLESAHSYCPMSAVCFGCLNLGQNLSAVFFPGAAIFGLLILVHSIFMGRLFCGYACPLGTIQELIYSINPKSCKFKQRNIISNKLHSILKWLKYLVLLAVIVLAGMGLGYIYMQFCPVLNIAHIQLIRLAGIISLIIIFILGYFVERFWCNYLCPYAALLILAQYLGKLFHLPRSKISWNKENCTSCLICNNICPMQINVPASNTIENPECIYCKRCQMHCPVECRMKKEK